MKIHIVRVIAVLAVLAWLLIASLPQIVLAQTCTNSDNRPVPCPPSSGGGKKRNNTAKSPVVIQATDTPIPLPTATVTVLAVFPIPGGGQNPVTANAQPPAMTDKGFTPSPFTLVGLAGLIIVVCIIAGFGAVKNFRKAGGFADGSGKMGGQPHMDNVPGITYPANELDVFPRSQDEDHFDGQIFGGKLPSPDAPTTSPADGSDRDAEVTNKTTMGSGTPGAGSGKAGFGEFNINKTSDNAPSFPFKNATVGTHYQQVNLEEHKTGEGDPLPDVGHTFYNNEGANPPPADFNGGGEPIVSPDGGQLHGGGGGGGGTNADNGRHP